MKRPIIVAVIGYIIGIIMGLYFKFSIVLFYIPLLLLAALMKIIINKIKTEKKRKNLIIFYIPRYFRYIKLILNQKVLIIIIIFSILSNSIVLFKNYKFDKLYENIEDIELIGTVKELEAEKDYKKVYKVKVLKVNNSSKQLNTYLDVNVDKKINLEFGEKVRINGKFRKPEVARNYGGFDYSEYLKTLNIYGTVNATSVKKLEGKNDFNLIIQIEKYINELINTIRNRAKKLLSSDEYSIYLGLVLGDTSQISENINEQFRNSNMSHILAVSGMHISYIILGMTIALNKTIGKRISKIMAIIILLFYCTITGFSASVIRACIMEIMAILAVIIHRKNDVWTSIAVSIFIILIYNPYLITSVSFQFTYVGTIGIILFNNNVLYILNKGKENKSRLKKIASIPISAQILILPLTIFHFNTFGIYFLITGVLLGFIIAPIIVLGFIFLILLIINFRFVNFLAVFVKLSIKLLLLISNLSYLPFSKVYVRTPQIGEILLWYFLVFLINYICSALYKKSKNLFNLRIRDMLAVFKYRFIERKKKVIEKYGTKIIASTLLVIIVVGFIICFILFEGNKNLKIHFVDVGQGDCCFIVTPNNKTILIDGGGNEQESFDVGKNTLIPYILDRGYTKIDYIFVSHFDTDHVGGLLTVMEELEVGKVIISKQWEDSGNYRKFKEIVKEKKIKFVVVNKGDRLKIENYLYFDILWPNNSNLILENGLNNNSIVCKLNYRNFSMLFTGDIEEIAEKQILQEYKNNLQVLNSTVLKVGHHGSKTSSTKEFIEAVKPGVALIGVGKNNKFGHPNDDVIERLENLGSKIYRTDQMGEIVINIDSKGRINTKKFIEQK